VAATAEAFEYGADNPVADVDPSGDGAYPCMWLASGKAKAAAGSNSALVQVDPRGNKVTYATWKTAQADAVGSNYNTARENALSSILNAAQPFFRVYLSAIAQAESSFWPDLPNALRCTGSVGAKLGYPCGLGQIDTYSRLQIAAATGTPYNSRDPFIQSFDMYEYAVKFNPYGFSTTAGAYAFHVAHNYW